MSIWIISQAVAFSFLHFFANRPVKIVQFSSQLQLPLLQTLDACDSEGMRCLFYSWQIIPAEESMRRKGKRGFSLVLGCFGCTVGVFREEQTTCRVRRQEGEAARCRVGFGLSCRLCGGCLLGLARIPLMSPG